MTDKIIRLFKILLAIQANPGITAKELADKCETTERTIYRDLRILDLIAPITNEGYGEGYRFVGNFAMYPLNFTEQEALVFSVLPSVLDTSKLPPGFDSAYDKVMATHVKETRKRYETLENVADMIQMGTPAYRETSTNFLLPIMQAIISNKTIRAVYHTQSRNELTEREIDPYYLVPRDQRFYLIGYCHAKREIRTFRLSRFRQVEMTSSYFDKGDFNIAQYMKHTWSIERGDSLITFKIKFHADVARYVKEEELFVRPKMTDLPDGSLLFEVTVNHEREFMNWVVQYGPSAEILEPVSIREKFKEQLANWRQLYEK
ncbi:helix-turn-helix transcriptional regulator [Paenibacillus naphthalenovorans]|uniref:helix-turn-helix transcriptional regulator n=1 Tax=Paenibacillus naphthalenovorans TaxID=162209 RepID=UPI00088F74C8|nr:transcriptional regulator [Paenibacillus naphthalenovorans]SDJ83897.1 Predicted DNA-binding transcriptional regulator YafY, contains an HTH and WYL domains [Paenibacillus naphthalenovorans]